MTKDFEVSEDSFFEELINPNIPEHCSFAKFENPWKDGKNIENLKKFLNLKERKNVKYILIGEAAGRKGCLQSGIPFCDTITATEIIELEYDENFLKKAEETSQRIYDTFGKDFIAWNVFPFNPQKENGQNRKPNKAEREYGVKLLKEFLQLFYNKNEMKIILLGKVAENVFEKDEVLRKHHGTLKLIHPSPCADRYRKNDDGKRCCWKKYYNNKIK